MVTFQRKGVVPLEHRPNVCSDTNGANKQALPKYFSTAAPPTTGLLPTELHLLDSLYSPFISTLARFGGSYDKASTPSLPSGSSSERIVKVSVKCEVSLSSNRMSDEALCSKCARRASAACKALSS